MISAPAGATTARIAVTHEPDDRGRGDRNQQAGDDGLMLDCRQGQAHDDAKAQQLDPLTDARGHATALPRCGPAAPSKGMRLPAVTQSSSGDAIASPDVDESVIDRYAKAASAHLVATAAGD